LLIGVFRFGINVGTPITQSRQDTILPHKITAIRIKVVRITAVRIKVVQYQNNQDEVVQ